MTQHAQVQVQKNITEQESLGMVQSLLRVSIYHMTQLRGLFPDSYYEDVTMKKLDGEMMSKVKFGFSKSSNVPHLSLSHLNLLHQG